MVLKITVKTLDSQNYQFEANDDWNVRQFKELIQPTVNVSSDEQRLIFCGRVLQDDKKLTDYHCDGKVIHLVRRPPPPLEDPNRDSSTADSNNNGGVGMDESNVLFSAMTLGPEANQVLRQLLTLRQASYARATGNEGLIETTLGSMTETERHLHNAIRLLRVTLNSIRECRARIAALPMPTGAQATSDASQPVVIAASSQIDLQRSVETQASETTAPETTVDDINVRSSFEGLSGRPQTRARVPRQSLTTDDLPQSGSPQPDIVFRPFEPRTNNGRRNTLSLRRREGSLDRYLTLLNYSDDLQDQLQGLVRRYRQLIDMSRRGGLIVPEASTSASASEQLASQPNPQLSSALMNEARILGLHIPRIMHHMSHLQHALSNFSVDFTRGRLLLCLSSSDPRLSQRRFTRRSDSPVNGAPRTLSHQPHTNLTVPPRASARPSPRLEGSVTITATAVDAGPPISSAPNTSHPQANATIIVTSEPSGGIHVPLSIPISFSPDGSLNMDFTGTRIPPATPRTQSGSVDQPAGSAQQQPNTTPNTTPAPFRPLSVLTGRVPIPYDYYLSCSSPWANINRPGEASTSLVQLRFARQQGASTQSSSTEDQAANASQANSNGPGSPSLDMGLTEVVSNIVGTILRGPQVHPTGADSNQNQDPLLNIIPELALNAASQILGGVLGLQTSNQQATASQNQQQHQQQPIQQQQDSQQRQMPPVSGTVMMDIDIDDSSSSQSESHYQDARETESSAIAATAANLPSTSSSLAHRSICSLGSEQHCPLASSSNNRIKYDRQQLVEVMHNHPDWIPIIEADINLMERQSAGTNNQPVFSDAYLSSIPRKRRRLLTASPDRVFILQPSPSQAITNLLRRAITNSNSSDIEALDQVLGTISSDADLQSAYEDYIKSAVEARLRSDYDYCPQKFENSSKYFK